MKLLNNRNASSVLKNGSVAAIGNFDGVHLGHQALLKALRQVADQCNLPMVCIIFEPQPREYFLKNQAPSRLTSLRQKIQIMQRFGVDHVCCLKFNHDMSKMSAQDFTHTVIFSQLQVKHLLVGNDFRFGFDRLGDVALLKEIAKKYRANIEAYPDVCLGEARISSTLIRQILQSHSLSDAEQFLGRKYSICGRVIYGDGLARSWGIPTANLKMKADTLPLKGVFFVEVRLTPVIPSVARDLQEMAHTQWSTMVPREGDPSLCSGRRVGGKMYSGVANVGRRPTLDGKQCLLEVHLLNFHGDLYGQWIEVFFLHKLRDEVKFSSKDQLIVQIQADVNAAHQYFLECVQDD